MNQQQRRKAQRLRLKRDGDPSRGIPPRPLTPKEGTWLAWYDANVGPSPLQPKKPPEAPDEVPDLEPEPDVGEPSPEEFEELEAEQLEVPERPYIDGRTREAHDERRRAELAHVVAKLHASECTNEALRSAVNVQIASGQMLERACVIALELAESMKAERGDLVQQLIDAITARADLLQAQFEAEPEPEKKKKGGGINAGDVTAEVQKRMIDGIFPPKEGAAVTTPKDAPTT